MPEAPVFTLHCPICQTVYENTTFRRCPNDGSPLRLADGTELGWTGQVIQKRYLVAKWLGKGGMAQVYEAEHLPSGRMVAIKIVDPRLASEASALERFRREAHLLSRIAHPNVVAVEDFGTLPDGALFMVMERLRGQSLQQRLDEGELDPVDSLEVVEQVCDAVQAAHASGVAHRDIKPANIFLESARSSGRFTVKVLDFGISKLVSEETAADLTKAGTVFGTPEYMSPQQAKGKPADTSSDIYSIGVLLYRLLLGRVPFSADSYLGVLVRHITETVPWPEDLAAQRRLPAATKGVVCKALAKNPEQRYRSAQAFAEAIQGLRGLWSTGYSVVGQEVDSVRVPNAAPRSEPRTYRIVASDRAGGTRWEIGALAPDVYWVGNRTGGALECNTYLRVYSDGDKRVSVVIDPGPPRDLQIVGAKIASVIGAITDIDMVFINHQDPDVSSNALSFQQVNPRLHVVCSVDTWRLVQFNGLDPRRFSAVETFRQSKMRLTTGHEVQFVPSPFCHFRGAVMYYDCASRVLFTGDLFGGLTRSKHLVAHDEQWGGIDAFHQIYMPSSEAVRRAIARIRALDPRPRMLAPQHGAILTEDQIEPLFTHLESLPMGLEVEAGKADCEAFREALNRLIRALAKQIGAQVVQERLRMFEGDGTFPDLIVFADDLTIEDIKISPGPAAAAVVRELTQGVSAEHIGWWLDTIHQVQDELGVRIDGVPA